MKRIGLHTFSIYLFNPKLCNSSVCKLFKATQNQNVCPCLWSSANKPLRIRSVFVAIFIAKVWRSKIWKPKIAYSRIYNCMHVPINAFVSQMRQTKDVANGNTFGRVLVLISSTRRSSCSVLFLLLCIFLLIKVESCKHKMRDQ